VNKGLAIGISIVIVIGAIGVVYSLVTQPPQPEGDIGLGMSDIGEVEIIEKPSEQESAQPEEDIGLGMSDIGEVEITENATEQESPEAPDVQVTVNEGLGLEGTP